MKIIKWILLGFCCLLLFACNAKRNGYQILAKQPPHTLRVVTYNVNWGEGIWKVTRADESVAAIAKINADIVLLQETTAPWEKYIRQHLSGLYPYQYFHHYPNAGGLAVLAKFPITTTLYVFPGFGWHPGWIFTAKTKIGLIQFANLHLTPPLESEGNMGVFFKAIVTTKSVRKREIEFFYQRLNKSLPTIIAGDFNEGDIGDAVNYLQDQPGLLDVHALRDSREYTWEWRAGLLRFDERFDRVFYTDNLIVQNVQILHEGNSDHYPVIVDFSRK